MLRSPRAAAATVSSIRGSRRCCRSAYGTNSAPRSAASVSPVSSNRSRATELTATPAAAARSKNVGLGWYARATRSDSQVSAFRISPVDGTREV